MSANFSSRRPTGVVPSIQHTEEASVLVMCHLGGFPTEYDDHALNTIKSYLKNTTIRYDTLDKDEYAESTFKTDMMSETFGESHKGQYDAVYLQSCDGLWRTWQRTKYELVDRSTIILSILKATSRLVKDNGLLFFENFYDETFKQLFIRKAEAFGLISLEHVSNKDEILKKIPNHLQPTLEDVLVFRSPEKPGCCVQ